MNSREMFIDNLQKISLRLVEEKSWSILSNITNFLVSFDRGNWSSLPVDEQLFWLQRLQYLLGIHVLSTQWGYDNPILSETNNFIHHYIKSLEKKL